MKKKIMNLVRYAGMALVCFALSIPGHADATFQFTFNKKQPESKNAVSVVNGKERTLFVIDNDSGINGLRIKLLTGSWPARLSLLYRYRKDEIFKYLESWSLLTSRLVVRGNERTSGAMELFFRDENGGIPAAGDKAVGTINVTVQKRKEGMEVVLPSNILAGSKEIGLGWIDAFRQ